MVMLVAKLLINKAWVSLSKLISLKMNSHFPFIGFKRPSPKILTSCMSCHLSLTLNYCKSKFLHSFHCIPHSYIMHIINHPPNHHFSLIIHYQIRTLTTYHPKNQPYPTNLITSLAIPLCTYHKLNFRHFPLYIPCHEIGKKRGEAELKLAIMCTLCHIKR